jgi:hypothetical protein
MGSYPPGQVVYWENLTKHGYWEQQENHQDVMIAYQRNEPSISDQFRSVSIIAFLGIKTLTSIPQIPLRRGSNAG